MRTITPTVARRLAISRQRLAGEAPTADPAGLLEMVRQIGCLQLDPINAVARSHLLVLWSRVGGYDEAALDRLLWEDRALFEYWAHCASIVLTEDYPLFRPMMDRYATGNSATHRRTRKWVEENEALRCHVLRALEERGPLLSREIEDHSDSAWQSGGWNSGRTVSWMLDFLWTKGKIMVAGRQGVQRRWDLAERCLPADTPREPMESKALVRHAAQRSLRALGVATPKQISNHFIRGCYPGLKQALAQLEAEGTILPVRVEGEDGAWQGDWYVHGEDLPLLDQLESGKWAPRTTLLSPFDNLICDRERTEQMWDFHFRIEIYVPKAKRQYGYYVMPILHGDRLIGRLDSKMDRKSGRYEINALYAEPDAPASSEVAAGIRGAIEGLASFLGAREIGYPAEIPEGWRKGIPA